MHLPLQGRRLLVIAGVVTFVLAGSVGYLIRGTDSPPSQEGASQSPTSRPLPEAGEKVPAFDLASDPVFPTLSVGYAIERHETPAGSTEAIARTSDGGRSWRLGGSFPFANGYTNVQFTSSADGYAFGEAGVAITRDGGRAWRQGGAIDGRVQRLVPIGDDVWATYTVCAGPPEQTTFCRVHVAISRDGGLMWTRARRLPLRQPYDGGNILARVTLTEAYIVSYGPRGGGLVVTKDAGREWATLPDPCAGWSVVDLAALWGGHLWMVCGGAPLAGGRSAAKAVFQSGDGGRTWQVRSYSGFGPASGPLAQSGPIGAIPFEGLLSQLATVSPSQAWIGVAGVGVLATVDGGRIWMVTRGVRETAPDSVGVTFNDAVHGWAIEFQQGVFRTSNGYDWTRIDGT